MSGNQPDPQQRHADARFQQSLECLSREIARLEQLVAALVFILWDQGSSLTEACEAHDALADWAMQTFDPESLTESLAEFRRPLAGPPVRMTGGAAGPCDHQRNLFAADESTATVLPGDIP